MEIGIKGKVETVVNEANTAKFVGSGSLDVFATPNMVGLMEQAAQMSVAPYLEEGQGTVGTRLDISHDAATPLGMKVHAESELVAIDRRKLTFKVAAYDEKGLIGEGMHERFIIDITKFQNKADEKSL